MNYLMIQNPGEASIEGLTLLGATSKDPSSLNQIGMFGSGTKLSVLCLLRNGLYPVIYSGTTRLTYSIRGPIKEVFVSVNGKAERTCGCTVDYGRLDWDNIAMALREFISNALDAVEGDRSKIRIEIVPESKVRAKSGTTRVFLPWSSLEPLERVLQTYFLHWRENIPNPYESALISKTIPSPATFYRRGVLLCKSPSPTPSLWDYNFSHLKPDEARKMDSWSLAVEASKLLAASPTHLLRTLREISNGSRIWESTHLNEYTLQTYVKGGEYVASMAKDMFGDVCFASAQSLSSETAKRKGFSVVEIPSTFYSVVKKMGLATVDEVLDWSSREGLNISPLRPEWASRVRFWASTLSDAGLTGEVPFPCLFEFSRHPNSSNQAKGFCRFGTLEGSGVYFHEELGGIDLDLTILEELAHWYSGENDFTRGFQEFLLRLVHYVAS
jgi:hypothetical protein